MEQDGSAGHGCEGETEHYQEIRLGVDYTADDYLKGFQDCDLDFPSDTRKYEECTVHETHQYIEPKQLKQRRHNTCPD